MTKDNAPARTQDAEAGLAASLSFTQIWSSIMLKFATFLVASGLAMGTAFAHQQGKKLHLADAPPDQQVEAITHCNGVYRVTTKEGSPVEYREFDLRFKTDGGPDGPAPGTPVVTRAGMRGDRGFVIFFAPGEISPFIKAKC